MEILDFTNNAALTYFYSERVNTRLGGTHGPDAVYWIIDHGDLLRPAHVSVLEALIAVCSEAGDKGFTVLDGDSTATVFTTV